MKKTYVKDRSKIEIETGTGNPTHWVETVKFEATYESEVEVIHVIKTTLCRRGLGKAGDPIRKITQYWDMQGHLLWEIDPCIKK